MLDYLKKLTGGGKTLALGISAVLVKVLTPIAQSHGWDIPPGFEDAVATILLFLMGFVGLGSKTVKSDEKVKNVNANIEVLTTQVLSLQAIEDERKRVAEEIKRKEEEAKKRADEELKKKAEAEEKAAEEAKIKEEAEEKEKLRKEVEELKKQLEGIK